MRFGLTANIHVPDSLKICREVLNGLGDQEVTMEDSIASHLGTHGEKVENMDVDILVTVGGDGTILRALQLNDAPVLGINAGVLGFLTEIPREEIPQSLRRVLRGDYILERRLKLKTVMGGKRCQDAMNEAVVHTAHIAKIRQFRVYVDDELVVDTRADGVIVATPTGSTCYAMSVGAPIVAPNVEALVIAPMAPFKFSARPFVVPADSTIRIDLVRRRPCVLVVDGQDELPVDGSRSIEFTRSENEAEFVRLESNFYSRTREKLMGSL